MASFSDPPSEPEPGGVVDPGVLERRRARREAPSSLAEVERLRAQQQLSERRSAELEAEVALVSAELDRRTAERVAVTSQVARLREGLTELRERVGAEESRQATTSALLADLRAVQEQAGQALLAVRSELAGSQSRLAEERAHRAGLEALVAEERAGFAAELVEVDAAARAEREALAHSLEAAQRTVAALEAEVDAAHEAFRARRAGGGLRSEQDAAAREERDAVVERLVTELVGTVEGLRTSFVAELEALEGERAALVASTGDEAVVRAERLRSEVERLRAATRSPSAVYDRPVGGARVPAGDHPALAATPVRAGGSGASGVAVDLDLAAARLRSDRVAPSVPPHARQDAPGPGGEPEPGGPGLHRREPSPAAPWLAGALAALAEREPALAERVLLAALAVQGPRVVRDVAYELELPVTGRHHVRAPRGGPVVVTRLIPGQHRAAEFHLAGSAAALAPLVAGGSPRRMPGVAVRGRRRRLRRLLRVLRPTVGLDELRASGAPLDPADLLALIGVADAATARAAADDSPAATLRRWLHDARRDPA